MTVGYANAFASYTGPQNKPVIDRARLTELAEIACLENRACARKVALAATIWDSCIHQTVQVGQHITDAGNYAASETARVLGCSKTVADTLAEIGMDLRLRLPAVKAAFDAGELDLARVRVIYRCTNSFTLDAAQRAESEVLSAARRLSPGPLATEITAIMLRIAPAEAAQLRKDLAKLTGVRYRDKDMIATIEADLEAADAAASWQLINEMAATVCPRDPRTKNQRLAAAYSALLRREDHVVCTCKEDDDNPCTAQRTLPDRRAPLTNVTIDLATLAGLSDLPGYLAGHGLIDADYARELAANGHWQLIVTEATDLAAQLGLTNNAAPDNNTVSADHTPSSPPDTTRAQTQPPSPAQPHPHTERGRADGRLVFNPLGRGRRRRKLKLPPAPAATSRRAHTGHYRGTYTLIAAIEAAIAADPTLAIAEHPDGHGGHTEPPGGALTYRPGAALADSVRHRDRTCRHPGCDVPAPNCEIDHIVPYNHHNPTRGGWTITSNLHCLCRYHHSLKTMGTWTPTMLTGAVEHWTSTSGTTAVTLPGNTVSTTDMSDGTLLPHIPRKRRSVGVRRSRDATAARRIGRDDHIHREAGDGEAVDGEAVDGGGGEADLPPF